MSHTIDADPHTAGGHLPTAASVAPAPDAAVPGATDVAQLLRRHGLRVTAQRQLVLDVVRELGHGTAEQIGKRAQQLAPGVNASTIYRTVELFEQLGLVTHTHLGHGAPLYQLAEYVDHIHAVCRRCGRVQHVPADAAQPLVALLQQHYGFAADVGHLSVDGWCGQCAPQPQDVGSAPSEDVAVAREDGQT